MRAVACVIGRKNFFTINVFCMKSYNNVKRILPVFAFFHFLS